MLKRLSVQSRPEIINNLTHNLTYTDNGATVTIASDAAINERILTRYKFYDYLYTIDEANETILQDIINKWRYKAVELYKTTKYEYNPIWNVDGEVKTVNETEYGHTVRDADGRIITNTDTRKTVTKQEADATSTTTYGKTDTATQTVDAQVHRSDNGYDQTSASPSYNETSNAGTSHNSASGSDTVTTDAGEMSSTNSGSLTETHTGSDVVTHSGSDAFTETVTRSGNIGVTTTQSMIREERDIILDVIDFYVSQFAEAFNINPLIYLSSYVEE